MKIFMTFLLLMTQRGFAQSFQMEASNLVKDLKTTLVSELTGHISQKGVVDAISFCHLNVKPIAKKAVHTRIDKFEFGRTSHRVRNEQNSPAPWIGPYLAEFQGKSKNEIKKEFILHQLENGKKVYLEPLYVEAKCLLCHGENISNDVSKKIKELYPQDQAIGFKLGEFRGFIWVKEK